MTFTEAAAHVLRLVGKPLHYKEITDVAIEKDLLSHVGKSPEVTMGARLAAVVKKDPKEHPLVRVKPGVFALREWNEEEVAAGLADRTPALERLARIEVEQGAAEEPPAIEEADPATEAQTIATSMSPGAFDEADEGLGEDERARAELAAAATDFFTAEEDDDEPILGGDDDEPQERTEAAGKRRRRRRRRRGGGDEDGGLPSYTVSDAPLIEADSDEEGDEGESASGSSAAASGSSKRSEHRAERSEHRAERSEHRAERSEHRAERSEQRSEPRGDRSEHRAEQRSEQRGEQRGPKNGDAAKPVDDQSAQSLLRALSQALSPKAKSPATPLRQAAEQVAKRLRGRTDLNALQDALTDAIRSEMLEARVARRRPRFVLSGKTIVSTSWGLSDEVVELEEKLQSMADRYRQAFAKSFSSRLQGLGARALSDLVPLLLRQMGYQEIEPVRRPGGHSQELHFVASSNAGAGTVTTAIVVRKDGRDLGRERVVELRGSLHHYRGAMAGLLITTGQILSGARDEARVEGASPVTLLDGVALAGLCEQHGVGVLWSEVRLPQVDRDLLEQWAGS